MMALWGEPGPVCSAYAVIVPDEQVMTGSTVDMEECSATVSLHHFNSLHFIGHVGGTDRNYYIYLIIFQLCMSIKI